MLSATELARMYGLYNLNNNPNGLLVKHILADYISNNNLNISDYYYPHGHGVMKVYPSMIYQKALNDFIFNLEEGKEYTYIIQDKTIGKSKINYKYKIGRSGKIISISERKTANGRK